MKGGQIHGGTPPLPLTATLTRRLMEEYPDDLTSKGPLNVGRGRLIPTRGWESLWHGIAEWMGVEQSEMDTIIPNKKWYPDDQLFKATDLFKA